MSAEDRKNTGADGSPDNSANTVNSEHPDQHGYNGPDIESVNVPGPEPLHRRKMKKASGVLRTENDMRIIRYAEKSEPEEDEKFSTGPIDSELIRKMSETQKRQTELNAKQKKKHERDVAYAENEPIRIDRLERSFKYAFQGLWYVIKTQPNMKIHLIAGTAAVVLGFLLKISGPEWLSIILVIGFVLILEVINTAIETLVDLYTEDFSFLAGVSKDLGATAVLIMAITSVIIGCVVFLPKIWALCEVWFGW